ncbi:MAG: hypothetical protein RJQ02_10070 [Hyphomonas sp.]
MAQAMFADRVASYHAELLTCAAALILFVAAADLPGKFRNKRQTQGEEQVSSSPWERFDSDTPNHIAEQKGETIRYQHGSLFAQRIRLRSKSSGNVDAEIWAIKLYDRSYWDFGSDKRLIVGRRRPVKLENELNSGRLRELFSKVEHVLCIGLVSNAEDQDGKGENLSLDRARRLEEWVRYSSVMLDQTTKLHAVPLGKALDNQKRDDPEEQNQRVGVLIGLKSENPLLTLPILIDQMMPYINAEIVRLDRYARNMATQFG